MMFYHLADKMTGNQSFWDKGVEMSAIWYATLFLVATLFP